MSLQRNNQKPQENQTAFSDKWEQGTEILQEQLDQGPEKENILFLSDLENDLHLLADIGKILTSTFSIREVLRTIMEKVNTILQPKHWSLFILDKSKEELYFGIAQGDVASQLRGLRLKLGEGISGWVAQEGKSVLVPDVRYDKRFSKRADQITSFVTKSIICVPMKTKDEVLGVIELVNTEEDKEFTSRDLNILLILADFAAIALENARIYKKIKKLSLKDPLTSSFNIRYLHSILDKWIKEESHFSMVFLDLDRFKQIVDNYGHLQGSKLLVEFSLYLNQKVKQLEQKLSSPSKTVQCSTVRYGGDEFILLLKGVRKEDAMVLSEQILKDLQTRTFSLEDGLSVQLNISMGVGHFPESASNKKDIMAKTDQAMFRAKDQGRGRLMEC